MQKWILNRKIEDIELLRDQTLDTGRLDAQIGALNFEDLNRISANLIDFKEKLLSNAYFTKMSGLKLNWTMSDIPYLEDINSIRLIALIVKNIFNISDYNSISMSNTLNFTEMNDIERLFFNTYAYNNNIKQQEWYCNIIECGGEY